MDPEYIIALTAIVSIFVVLPGMIFHYVTTWRRQKTLQPDDERMLEDLWRSARSIERRLETMEALIEDEGEEEDTPPRRRRPRNTDRFED